VNAAESKIDIFAEQTGQYIKIELTADKGGYWVVKELYVNLITEKDDRFGWTMTASINENSAYKALDGNTETLWESGPQYGSEWIVLDMKQTKTFNQILLNQRGSGGDYPRVYEVYVSNDVADWGTAVLTGTGAHEVTKINFVDDQTARYIKIAQTADAGGIYWKINEIYVKKESEFRFATATAYKNEGDANKALDRDLSTKWSNLEVQAGGETFTFDLGSSLTFDQVKLINGGDFPQSYALYVSDDPADFGKAVISGEGAQDETVIHFPNQTGRYIQIEQTGTKGGYWAIDEAYISLVTPVDPKNGWIMTASHNNDRTIGALDNDPDTRWDTGIVQEGGEYIVLDVLESIEFNQILLDNRGDYPRGYAVYVSDDITDFGEAVLTGVGSDGTTAINFAVNQTGRYIKIVQTGTSGGYWSIHEIYINLVTDKEYRFGWTMTASHNNDRASWALDGDLSTRWESGPQNGAEWIILDMKTAQAFNTILLNQNDGGDYPREYDVYVSDDAGDFGEPVASGTGTDKVTRIELAVDQTARYIKIAQTGTSGGIYWSINELDVENNERVSIPQVKNENGKLYYVPGQLVLNGLSPTATISLYNITGQMLKTVSGNQNTVNVNLAQGMYIVNVKDGAGSYCEKIVVK
jgi:hypothetical protein